MSRNRLKIKVPAEWRRILSELLNATMDNPTLSAQRYVIDRHKDKKVIDLLINKQFIKRDYESDTLLMHIMSLPLCDSTNAPRLMDRVNELYQHLRDLYIKEPSRYVYLEEIMDLFCCNRDEAISLVKHLIDLGVFNNYSTDLKQSNAYVHPAESILDYEDIYGKIAQWSPVWWKMRDSENGERIEQSGNEKSRRARALRQYLAQIDDYAQNQGLSWNSKSIPDNKEQFAEVFFDLYKDIKIVAPITLKEHAKELGAKFQPGTSNKSESEIRKLFENEQFFW